MVTDVGAVVDVKGRAQDPEMGCVLEQQALPPQGMYEATPCTLIFATYMLLPRLEILSKVNVGVKIGMFSEHAVEHSLWVMLIR